MGIARLSATAKAEVLRAARMEVAEVKWWSDIPIGIGELEGLEVFFD